MAHGRQRSLARYPDVPDHEAAAHPSRDTVQGDPQVLVGDGVLEAGEAEREGFEQADGETLAGTSVTGVRLAAALRDQAVPLDRVLEEPLRAEDVRVAPQFSSWFWPKTSRSTMPPAGTETPRQFRSRTARPPRNGTNG